MLNLTAVGTNLLSPSEYVQDMIMSGCVSGDSSAEGDLHMIQLWCTTEILLWFQDVWKTETDEKFENQQVTVNCPWHVPWVAQDFF